MSEMNRKGVSGCLFYTLQADNVTADENATTSFLVANPGSYAANVSLEVAHPTSTGAGWTPMQVSRVNPGASVRLPISGLQVTGVGLSARAALRISSDQPVTVVEIESDDVESVSTSSGGTMVLPLQSLGGLYRAVTYPQAATDDVQATAGSRGGGARLIIVGTKDGTNVTFTPARTLTNGPNGNTFPAGVPYPFTLDDGDVFQIYSGAPGEDLSGAVVSAKSSSVAVFSGNISTSYGSTVTGVNSADMAHEQMPPVQSWSTRWVAAAMTPQSSIGCTSFFGMDGASIWLVVASQDGTNVMLAGPGVPSVGQRLNAGEVHMFVEVGSFTVSANYPILVTQGIDCEPSLSLAVAIDATTILLKSLPIRRAAELRPSAGDRAPERRRGRRRRQGDRQRKISARWHGVRRRRDSARCLRPRRRQRRLHAPRRIEGGVRGEPAWDGRRVELRAHGPATGRRPLRSEYRFLRRLTPDPGRVRRPP